MADLVEYDYVGIAEAWRAPFTYLRAFHTVLEYTVAYGGRCCQWSDAYEFTEGLITSAWKVQKTPWSRLRPRPRGDGGADWQAGARRRVESARCVVSLFEVCALMTCVVCL